MATTTKKFNVGFEAILTFVTEIEIKASSQEEAEEKAQAISEKLMFEVVQTKESKKEVGKVDFEGVDQSISVDFVDQLK